MIEEPATPTLFYTASIDNSMVRIHRQERQHGEGEINHEKTTRALRCVSAPSSTVASTERGCESSRGKQCFSIFAPHNVLPPLSTCHPRRIPIYEAVWGPFCG